MRRAISAIVLAASVGVLPAGLALAQDANQIINGIGLIDFSRHDLHAGQWTRYHVTGHGTVGTAQDYVLTIGVAGEERFWGDDCFWIESFTQQKTGSSQGVATLMSFGVFDDTLPLQHMQYYIRKNIVGVDLKGVPLEELAKRPPKALTTRPIHSMAQLKIDTLEVDTIQVERGKFTCRKYQILQNVGREAEERDSTTWTENKDNRYSYVSRDVPLTGIVREDLEFTETRKAWLVGRSQEAVTATVVHSVGRADLVEFGNDYKGQMIAESKRHSLLDRVPSRAGRATPAHATSPRKPAATRKPG